MISPRFLAQLTLGVALAGAGVACDRDRPTTVDPTIEERAREAGDSAADAATEAGARAQAAIETADVKAALAVDDTIDSTEINVDTDHATKVVTLKGTVGTDAERDRAGEIASREAVGYRIENLLTVRTR